MGVLSANGEEPIVEVRANIAIARFSCRERFFPAWLRRGEHCAILTAAGDTQDMVEYGSALVSQGVAARGACSEGVAIRHTQHWTVSRGQRSNVRRTGKVSYLKWKLINNTNVGGEEQKQLNSKSYQVIVF